MSVFRSLLMQQDVYDTIYGTNSITFNAKANGLKALRLFGGIEQSGTPTPTTPQDIVSNNGAIKLSPNEFNPNDVELGYYLSGGNKTASAYNFLTALMPVKPNTSYVLYGKRKSDNRISSYNRLYWYDINKNYIKTDNYTYGQITVASSPNNAYYAQGGINESGGTSTPITQEIINSYNWVFQEGNAEVPYIPYGDIYTDGTIETVQDSLSNTATAEMLLKVGNYQDVQSVLDGKVTRNVGIKVLDGTENWAASGNLFYAGIATDALEDTHSCYCTHFKGVATNASANYDNEIKVGTNATQTVNWTRVQIYPVVGTYSNVTAFKQFLADQYANGTPVIVVYPLATSTTETVTGQTLTTQEGTNRITITQASISNLDLEAKYKKGNGDIDWQVGDRLDNKASFVGYFNSINPNTQTSQRYAVFALDAVYRSLTVKFCGYGSSGNFTPSYSSTANARGAKESATYNTDYMLTNNSNLDYLQGYTSARQATTVSYNGVTYNAQTPNLVELELIRSNYTTLDTKDPTIIDNTTKTLEAMLTAGIWSSTLYYGTYLNSFYAKKTSTNYARATNNYYGIVPVIEIPVAGV